ncbi:MAG: phenylalanine--tRNA ligase subunit beta [Puniceicoccales bacterium]|jgi:phenylalanyl-tRNA synthetase beta chain|nr:phenylalanine--tRNA ligase subunit beta [Puniceicoccales bacterium]
MKIALNTLKRYIHFKQSVTELCEILVGLGFEVDNVEAIGYCGKGDLVVGRVLKKEKHPHADRLSVCKVDVGRDSPLQIVCGATNFKEGDMVPIALPGAQLGETILKKTRIRDVESCGMMCSANELGLGKEGAGLYILNDLQPNVGEPLAKLFADQSDTVIDLSITSNRGDCLSYLGIARELSAALDLPVIYSECLLDLPPVKNISMELNSDACDYYAGCLLKNVHVGPSPDWLKNALQAVGLRPVNNVVDVTNFVLLERGQPLHAFDWDLIRGDHICIRDAHVGECIRTLDGATRPLPENTLLVADRDKPLAIAGIMGGEESEIKATTAAVFLESAHFQADSIRMSSRRLELSSESSYRFERHVDKTRAREALCRAVQLLLSMDDKIVCEQCVFAGSDTVPLRKVKFEFAQVERLLGFHVDPKFFVDTLKKLGFEVVPCGNEHGEVTIPAHRADVAQVVDLVEEFLRLFGTDSIPSKMPEGPACCLSTSNIYLLKKRHAQLLSAHGFLECYTDSLQPASLYENLMSEETLKALQVFNPLSAEHACLRSSLIPGLLNALCDNRHHDNDVERLFESGRIFRVQKEGQLCELFASAFVVCPADVKRWKEVPPFDFYDAQALVRSMMMACGGANEAIQSTAKRVDSLWQKDYVGNMGAWEQRGFEANFGYVNLNFTRRWFKEAVVLAGECCWIPDKLHIKDHKRFQIYSEYPAVRKDLALLVNTDILAETVRQNVEKSIRKIMQHPMQLKCVSVFDVFHDATNGKKKSLAFSLVFDSNVGTLTDEQVNNVFEKLQGGLERDYNYQIRRQVV